MGEDKRQPKTPLFAKWFTYAKELEKERDTLTEKLKTAVDALENSQDCFMKNIGVEDLTQTAFECRMIDLFDKALNELRGEKVDEEGGTDE